MEVLEGFTEETLELSLEKGVVSEQERIEEREKSKEEIKTEGKA